MTGYPFLFHLEVITLNGNPFPSDNAAYAFVNVFLVWMVSSG